MLTTCASVGVVVHGPFFFLPMMLLVCGELQVAGLDERFLPRNAAELLAKSSILPAVNVGIEPVFGVELLGGTGDAICCRNRKCRK
jgi:hypothetical protein